MCENLGCERQNCLAENWQHILVMNNWAICIILYSSLKNHLTINASLIKILTIEDLKILILHNRIYVIIKSPTIVLQLNNAEWYAKPNGLVVDKPACNATDWVLATWLIMTHFIQFISLKSINWQTNLRIKYWKPLGFPPGPNIC